MVDRSIGQAITIRPKNANYQKRKNEFEILCRDRSVVGVRPLAGRSTIPAATTPAATIPRGTGCARNKQQRWQRQLRVHVSIVPRNGFIKHQFYSEFSGFSALCHASFNQFNDTKTNIYVFLTDMN